MRNANDAAVEVLVSMGFERSRVFSAVLVAGTQEKALRRLTEDCGSISLEVVESGSNPSSVGNEGSADAKGSESDSSGSQADSSNSMAGPSNVNEAEQRDVEMEDAIEQELTGDPLADYDIEVTKEGEAITEYLALLASTGNV